MAQKRKKMYSSAETLAFIQGDADISDLDDYLPSTQLGIEDQLDNVEKEFEDENTSSIPSLAELDFNISQNRWSVW